MSSEVTHSDAGVDSIEANRKRKRKKLENDSNSLGNNDILPVHPKCTSSMNNSTLEKDSFEQPLVSTSLGDSDLMQHDIESRFSEAMPMGMQQTVADNALGSNKTSNDFQLGNGRDSPATTNVKYRGEVIVNSASGAAERDDQAVFSNFNKEMGTTTCERREEVKAYKRRQTDVSDSVAAVLGYNEDAGSSFEVKNRKLPPLLDGSDEASGCLKNTLEGEAEAGHVTSQKVVEDIFLAGMALGGCSDLEHAGGISKNGVMLDNSKAIQDGLSIDLCALDLAGEDFERAKRAKLNVDQDVLRDVNSVDKLTKECTRLCKEQIAFDDASDLDPSSEPEDQKIQPEIKDASTSSVELDEIKDNVTQTIKTENEPPQMPQSSMGRALAGCLRRKLLVLDVNGLLADIIPYVPDGYKADTMVAGKAVFKRPFCDDFIQFCFERFNVGVWSSRTKRNVENVLDFLVGKNRSNLLFVWDQSHCTTTGFNTLENKDKPLVLKELIKLWDKHEPDLPWERGDYNESNTLLLDDSPYKALRNPPNTAIFPYTYQYTDKKDNSLGSGGKLRVYLEGLALAENVQTYVEQHPYGQRPITKRNLSWSFYAKVMGTNSFKQGDYAHHSDLEHASRDVNTIISTKESKGTMDVDSFTKERPSADLAGESSEQVKCAKLDVHQNAECNMYSSEQSEGCKMICKEERVSDDTCGQDPPSEPLEEKSRPKMEDPIPSSSEGDALRRNASHVRNKEIHPPRMRRSFIGRDVAVAFKRKLLILDVSGLLADVVSYVPDLYQADAIIGGFGVFRRPFYDDFLQFCFERFSVGVWSTTGRRNVRLNVEFLMGEMRQNLLFCWDRSHCIEPGFSTLENSNRAIYLKELRRLWQKHESNLPWERGQYDESNTVLLDSFPSTALLNPPHTAVFPPRYRYKDAKDNSLGPGGDLRVYLEGLALAEDVQKYIEHNTFGEQPVSDKDASWPYYLKVINSISFQPQVDSNTSYGLNPGRNYDTNCSSASSGPRNYVRNYDAKYSSASSIPRDYARNYEVNYSSTSAVPRNYIQNYVPDHSSHSSVPRNYDRNYDANYSSASSGPRNYPRSYDANYSSSSAQRNYSQNSDANYSSASYNGPARWSRYDSGN